MISLVTSHLPAEIFQSVTFEVVFKMEKSCLLSTVIFPGRQDFKTNLSKIKTEWENRVMVEVQIGVNENGYSLILAHISMENEGKWEKGTFPKPQPISFVTVF